MRDLIPGAKLDDLQTFRSAGTLENYSRPALDEAYRGQFYSAETGVLVLPPATGWPFYDFARTSTGGFTGIGFSLPSSGQGVELVRLDFPAQPNATIGVHVLKTPEIQTRLTKSGTDRRRKRSCPMPSSRSSHRRSTSDCSAQLSCRCRYHRSQLIG